MIHGAAGILWFTAEARSNTTSQYITLQQELPQLWEMFSRIALEIRAITPTILSAAKSALSLRCNASLHARAWTSEDRVVIVMVNAGASVQVANCEVSGAVFPSQQRAEVLGESREVIVDQGLFVDQFRPIATHVYQLSTSK